MSADVVGNTGLGKQPKKNEESSTQELDFVSVFVIVALPQRDGH